jgi:hypothetical protein
LNDVICFSSNASGIIHLDYRPCAWTGQNVAVKWKTPKFSKDCVSISTMRIYFGLIDSWSALGHGTKWDDGQLTRFGAGWLPDWPIESRISGWLSSFRGAAYNMLFGMMSTIVRGIFRKCRLSNIRDIAVMAASRDFFVDFWVNMWCILPPNVLLWACDGW